MSRPFLSVRPVLIVALLVTGAVFAGCLGSEGPQPKFEATGADGTLYEGWAYDGSGSFPANASLSVSVDEPANTGRISVAGVWASNESFTIEITEFSHNEDDFHSGGVAANFVEHGDSGKGNALLPAMNLLVATWSTGQVLLNGTALNDTFTGKDVWSMHLMVTDTGTRDDDTGEVKNGEDGLYDPAAPGKAAQGSDTEAILVVSSTYPNATRPDGNATLDGSVGTRTTVDQPFEVEAAGAQIAVEVAIKGDPQELGPYVFRLLDPDGTNVAQTTVGPTTQRSNGTLSAESTKAGEYTLQVQSHSTGAAFTAEATIRYPPKPVWVLHWEDVDVIQSVVEGQ